VSRDRTGAVRLGRDARIWVLVWGLIGFAHFGVYSLLLNLTVLRLGYGAGFMGQLQGAGRLTSFAMALPSAAVGRRIGHRNAMLISVPLYIAATLLVAVAEAVPPTARAACLLAGSAMFWAGASLRVVNAAPYLMCVTQGEERGVALAAQQGATYGCAIVGSLVAGWLPGRLSAWLSLPTGSATPYRLSMLLATAGFALAGLALLRARPEAAMPVEAVSDDRPPLRVLLALASLMGVISVGTGAMSFMNAYLDEALHVPTDQIGVLMAISQLAPVAVCGSIPGLMRRHGATWTLRVSASGIALALAALALVPGAWLAGLAYVAAVGAAAVTTAAGTAFTQEAVPRRWRGTVSACVGMGGSLGYASAGWLGGALAAAAGYRPLFAAAAVAPLVAAALLSLRVRRAARTVR